MILKSKIKPQFFPDQDQTTVLKMGLQPLPHSKWMLVDADLSQFLNHKIEQKKLHQDLVYQALPESEEAQVEFYNLLQRHLINDHNYQLLKSGDFVNQEFSLSWENKIRDLWHCSLWIQEDICLLEKFDDEYILTAASVCSPSNWDMPSKIGQSVEIIHNPVPGYKEQMSSRVNRLMSGLKPNKSIQRLNWSIQPTGDMFWRSDLKNYEKSEEKYWRIERQTLMRLPQTRAIVFGIRVFLHSFSTMSGYKDFDQSIAKVIKTLPNEQANYKNLR